MTATTVPRLAITIAQYRIDARSLGSVVSATVHEELLSSAMATVRLLEPDRHGIGRIDTGDPLVLSVEGHERPLFCGEISSIEVTYASQARRELRIRAYDSLRTCERTSATRVVRGENASDAVADIVAPIGLTVVWHGSAPEPRVRATVQRGESDLSLLRRLLTQLDLSARLDKSCLDIFPAGEGVGTPVDLALRDLMCLRVEHNTDAVLHAITAHGWDARNARPLLGAAESGSPTGSGEAPATRRSGVLVHCVGTDDDTLADEARITIERLNRHSTVVRAVLRGDPAIRPGDVVTLPDSCHDAGSSRHVLTEVVHRVDASGFVTEISSARGPVATDAHVPATPVAGITLGTVRSVDDPDRLGRVSVALDGLGDVESSWLQVIAPGAGKDRGLVATPAIGDRVAVAAVDGDLQNAIVLGALFGEEHPPAVNDGEQVRRLVLRSRSGHEVALDDAADHLELVHRNGSRITISDTALVVHSATDLTIEAPGRALVVRARSVDFQEAP